SLDIGSGYLKLDSGIPNSSLTPEWIRLESNLTVLLLHLLKCKYPPSRRTKSWLSSISEHRRRIRKAFRDSPSLKPYFEKVLSEVYADAVKQAVIETELSKNTFLDECPFTTAQIMDENFPPEMIQE
ncbi:MAG: DUF29 domain-containing protein, partial [Cyanobacteria bacterium J06554_6]